MGANIRNSFVILAWAGLFAGCDTPPEDQVAGA